MRQVFNMAMARSLCAAAHGSGLDTEPSIGQSRRNTVIKWAFHMMGEHGFYRGYWRFLVRTLKADPLEFRLTGMRGNTRAAVAYGLKDYLEERFANALGMALGNAAITAELREGKWSYSGSVDADV
jgi:hypothetical protein